MKPPWAKLEGPAKLLVICATFLLVAAGLCGLQFGVFSIAGQTSNLASYFMWTGAIELVVMALSAVGAVIAVVALIAEWMYSRFSR